MRCNGWVSGVVISALVAFSANAEAAPKTDEYILTIKDKQFLPKELPIPAGQKIKVIVKNLNSAPAEFESHDLNREKIIGANSEITLFIGPLEKGSYTYYNDFDTTVNGVITAQ